MRLLLLLTILWISSADAQTVVFEGEQTEGTGADVDCTYLSRGPLEWMEVERSQTGEDVCAARAYRVAFYLGEIYYSLWIEELSFKGVECGDITAVGKYFLNGFDIGQEFFKSGRLTGLEFERWESWNTFFVREYGDSLRIEALGDDKFRFTKLGSK